MSRLDDWLEVHARSHDVPLFDTDGLVVRLIRKGSRTLLKRHPAFDAKMIEVVEAGITSDSWAGIVYLMHWLREGRIYPLYIGKTERRGTRHALSHNIKTIRANEQKFGRWGYGLDYHIGDLSHSLFRFPAYRAPTRKYQRWAETLFCRCSPPELAEPVYVALIPWYQGMRGPSGLTGSVPAVEKELIGLASGAYPTILLNADGR